MYSMVKRLRRNGARLSDRDIAVAQAVVGHLAMVSVGGTVELKLYGAGDDGLRTPLIPILYNARLVTMHGNCMLLEGDEREGDDVRGRTLKQEWSVKLAVAPPADIPQPTRRLDGL